MTYTERRQELKDICQSLLNVSSEDVGTNNSVNKKLELMYADGDETVLFRTFEEWVKMGYLINKGAKAFLFWGTPQEFEIRKPEDITKIVGVGSYCPVIFKFSENQVSHPQNVR